jgi:hypothetical protein
MTQSDPHEQRYGLSQYQQIAFLKYCWELDSLEQGFLEQYFLAAASPAIENEAISELDIELDAESCEVFYETLYEILDDALCQNMRPSLVELDETRSYGRGRQLRRTLSERWMPVD